MKSIYLTKGASDVFDKIRDYDPIFPKIIDGLVMSMNRSNALYSDREVVGKGDLTVNLLKEVLGDKVSDDDYEKFIKVFNAKLKNTNWVLTEPENKINDMGYHKNKLNNDSELIKTVVKLTDKFKKMLDDLTPILGVGTGSEVIWALYDIDGNPDIKNKLSINELDISNKEWCFNIKTNGKPGTIKIGQFLRLFFGTSEDGKAHEIGGSNYNITAEDINAFANRYNKYIGKSQGKRYVEDDLLKPRNFTFDPKNVKETFISLVTETYPYGTEEEVLKYLPPDLTRDEHGNYYKIIGESDTVFTCHLDTASRTKSKVGLITYKKGDEVFIKTDGKSILGADDKAGVAVLLYMMAHGIKGVYWFFIGEERGGIGSGKVSDTFDNYPFMEGKKKVISFDRRNYYSVITQQMGTTCCSNEFASSLCKELNKSGLRINLDPTGVFTDSFNFVSQVPECTNVSVGYFNEHTHDEIQNITYLERLAIACVNVSWDELVVKRRVGFDEVILKKYSKFISGYKKMSFYNNDSMKGEEGKIIIDVEINDSDVDHLYTDITALQQLFALNKIDPDIIFEEDHIKIELA